MHQFLSKMFCECFKARHEKSETVTRVCSQLAPDVAAGLLAESGSSRGFGVTHQTQCVRSVHTVAAYTEHRCEESQKPMR